METSSTENNYLTNSQQNESWHVSRWTYCACFATGCTTLLITLAKCISLTPNNPGSWLRLIIVGLVGYLFADFATGIHHWAIDNYGGPQTPIFGSLIEAFQWHHQQPWAISKMQLARNLYILSVVVTIAVMPVNVLSDDPFVLGFVCVFWGCGMFSQLFHAWAHTSKGEASGSSVVALQDAGVLVGRAEHVAHHRPPYNRSYCIVSGMWNRLLDWSRFFFGLEFVIFNVFGVKPRSWSDPAGSD